MSDLHHSDITGDGSQEKRFISCDKCTTGRDYHLSWRIPGDLLMGKLKQ